ncbi:MAG: metallopeptidase TldD-related protein [candidate division WOR-3 bacterium]
MFKGKLLFIIAILFSGILFAQGNVLITTMEKELKRSFTGLKNAGKEPLYFLQYEIIDEEEINIAAFNGAIQTQEHNRNRYLTVDVRVGNYKLDNTHQLRGQSGFAGFEFYAPSYEQIPLEDDEFSIREVLWKKTDEEFKKAQERLMKVKAEKTTKVTESDTSPDFSKAEPQIELGTEAKLAIDTVNWAKRLKELSKIFKEYPWLYSSNMSLTARAITKYLVNTDGTKIIEPKTNYLVRVSAATKAEDGMRLSLYRHFYSHSPNGLPTDDAIKSKIDELIKGLADLRQAPLVDPYSGPAILKNVAAGVFFHEIFGHRIEGHRQKLEREGQTFKDKVGTKILPDFISIYDDPTLSQFGEKDLNGYYRYDNEGVKAQRVPIVENGVLKNFLTTRSPIENFPKSNGHGRRQYGYKVVARQGNLIIESKNQVPYDSLRQLLIAECKRQNKPYGLIFEDIAGGFTMTGRGGLQAFNVTPLLVKRVYTDGREEVVRGVNIVGTPLIAFSKILATGDDPDVFNGSCGAESGMIPVSAVSPSILTAEMEVEKKAKEQEKLPILPAPIGGKK